MKAHNEPAPQGGWMGSLWHQLTARRPTDDSLDQAVERVIQIADPMIRQAKGYRKTLGSVVASASDYFRSLLDTLPGPIPLDRSRYYDDPRVKALFASPDELDELLRFSPEINAVRRSGGTGEMVALMTMQQDERTIFGHRQEGEMLLREVRQQAVSFSAHRIVGPAADLETTRAGIVDRGLEVLATAAMERITGLRAQKAELEGRKAHLTGMVQMLGGRTRRQGLFAAPTAKNREELGKVEQLLAEVEQEQEAVRAQIGLPEQSLAILEAILNQPEQMLSARRLHLRLNWMGVRVDETPAEEGSDLNLAEFAMEELHRSAVLVTFTLPPAPPA